MKMSQPARRLKGMIMKMTLVICCSRAVGKTQHAALLSHAVGCRRVSLDNITYLFYRHTSRWSHWQNVFNMVLTAARQHAELIYVTMNAATFGGVTPYLVKSIGHHIVTNIGVRFG